MAFEKTHEQNAQGHHNFDVSGMPSMMPPAMQLKATKSKDSPVQMKKKDDTPVWTTTNNWGDQIKRKDHKIRLGKDFKKDMTYTDAWRIMAPKLQQKYLDKKTKIDCADFSMRVMVEFAYMFELPVRVDDYKAEGTDPSFNNDAGGYKEKNGKWIDIETGDWKGFADGMQKHYGAADLYNNRKMTSINKDVKFNEGDNLQPGNLLGYKYDNGTTYHSQTVSEVKDSFWFDFDEDVDYFTAIQGSLSDGKPTPLFEKDYNFSSFKYNEENEKIRYGNSADVRVMDWNFARFDKNR
ncbi:MAG: hypothetical protein AAGN35_02020 [Bacteroidota bacterium]